MRRKPRLSEVKYRENTKWYLFDTTSFEADKNPIISKPRNDKDRLYLKMKNCHFCATCANIFRLTIMNHVNFLWVPREPREIITFYKRAYNPILSPPGDTLADLMLHY